MGEVLNKAGDFARAEGDLIGSEVYLFFEDAMHADGGGKLMGDHAANDSFDDDEEGMDGDITEAGGVVENGAGQEPPAEKVMQGNDDGGSDENPYAGEVAKHGEEAEDMEVGFDLAVGEEDEQGGLAHGGGSDGQGGAETDGVETDQQSGAGAEGQRAQQRHGDATDTEGGEQRKDRDVEQKDDQEKAIGANAVLLFERVHCPLTISFQRRAVEAARI